MGGLKDRHHRSGVVHGVVDHLAAQGAGLTRTKPGAEAQDQGVAVLDEVFLGREKAGGDLLYEFLWTHLAAGLEAGGFGQQATAGDVVEDAHQSVQKPLMLDSLDLAQKFLGVLLQLNRF